jgi:hypothetical protein
MDGRLRTVACDAAFELDELYLERGVEVGNVMKVIHFFEDMTWTNRRKKEREEYPSLSDDDWLFKGPDWVSNPTSYLMVIALMDKKWRNTKTGLVSDLVENVNTVVATLKGAIAVGASKETQAVMRSFCCDLSRFASAYERPRRYFGF